MKSHQKIYVVLSNYSGTFWIFSLSPKFVFLVARVEAKSTVLKTLFSKEQFFFMKVISLRRVFLQTQIKMQHKTLSTAFCHYHILAHQWFIIHEDHNKQSWSSGLKWSTGSDNLICWTFFVNKEKLCQFKWKQSRIFSPEIVIFPLTYVPESHLKAISRSYKIISNENWEWTVALSVFSYKQSPHVKLKRSIWWKKAHT